MKLSYILFPIVAILSYNVILAQRDAKMFKAYDACMQYTFHPDCPQEWRTKPAFAHH